LFIEVLDNGGNTITGENLIAGRGRIINIYFIENYRHQKTVPNV
jgi:hypothetical protein